MALLVITVLFTSLNLVTAVVVQSSRSTLQNEYGLPVTFSAGANEMLTGIYSVFNRTLEDRRWGFYSGSAAGVECSKEPFGALTKHEFRCGSEQVISGIHINVQSSSFKVQCCNISRNIKVRSGELEQKSFILRPFDFQCGADEVLVGLTAYYSAPGVDDKKWFARCAELVGDDTDEPTAAHTEPPSGLLTKDPTFPPTARSCIKKLTWTKGTAGINCPGRFRSKIFDIKACISSYQKNLEVSLANKLYGGCRSRCVYDYKTIIAGRKGAFLYKRRKNCYKYVTKGRCFRKKKKYRKAKRRAKNLC